MDTPRTIRLLVVEDNPAYMYLIQKAFRARPKNIRWQLRTAVDGDEAIRVLFEEEEENTPLPDLIILDWNLPKVSGAEVLKRIKQHQKLRSIPVLVFSTSDADLDIQAAYENHANGYIKKPDATDKMSAIVEAIELFWVEVAHIPKVARSRS